MTADHLAQLRRLHDMKRKAPLAGEAAVAYSAAVDELLAEALARQEASASSGRSRRRSVRLRRAVTVNLGWSTVQTKAVTLDLGLGGFSVLLGEPPPPDEAIVAVLHLRRGESVRSAVRVTDVTRRRGATRISLGLTDIPQLDAARLKSYLVEQLLSEHRASEPAESAAPRYDRSGRGLEVAHR